MARMLVIEDSLYAVNENWLSTSKIREDHINHNNKTVSKTFADYRLQFEQNKFGRNKKQHKPCIQIFTSLLK